MFDFQLHEKSFLLLTDHNCLTDSSSGHDELDSVCIYGLWVRKTGMFTPRDELAEELSVASKKAGEKFWCMPMEEGYWEFMKFNIADFVNTGSRTGGSITAALFLKEVIFTPSGLLACFPSFLHK